MNIAVFASGSGSNFQAIIDRVHSGDLPITISLLVGNNSKAKCFDRAREANIPTLHISPSHFETENEYADVLLAKLEETQVDLIVLAGYMKMLPTRLTATYRDRMINIHPSLLPLFGGHGMYGMNVHTAVKAAGVKISGVTIHAVTEIYDEGPILYQASVPVYESDTPEEIADRVLVCEHDSYWRVIKALAGKEISIENGLVRGTVRI